MTKEERKEYNKLWYQRNKERIDIRDKHKREDKLLYLKMYREKHKEKRALAQKKWKNDNKDSQRQYLSEWRENNTNYPKEYYKQNKEELLRKRIENKHVIIWRSIVYSVLNRLGTTKEGKTIELLGYSPIEFKKHIENLFTEGMSWENHGEWHVDHIKPVSKFDSSTPIKIVNSLNNLQPLWAIDNLIKRDKLCI